MCIRVSVCLCLPSSIYAACHMHMMVDICTWRYIILYMEVITYMWRLSFINAACHMYMGVFIYKCSLSYVNGGHAACHVYGGLHL